MTDLTQRHRATEIKTIFFSLCLCVSALNPTGDAQTKSRPNVLLISIDTLRADHLGCYGYKTKTPAIDALAAESILFENAISQVPLTLPSHSTIFTGLYPDQHGVRNNENFVLAGKLVTLAELFQQQGYATGGVVGSFSLDSTFGIDQGFQYYEDRIGKGQDPELNRHVERRADSVWDLGKKWIDAQKGPWFAFVHFFDPHFPYQPPAGYQQSYDGEIAYADRVVGSILDHLRKNQKLDTTIVILLSDHGESLGEHGEDNHGIFVYDSTIKVPLMIRAAGQTPQRVTTQVRLVDVAPTIAHLAGLKGSGFSGIRLLPRDKRVQQDLLAYSESYYANLLMGWAPLHSIRSNQKKWIDAPKAELYDLQKDREELMNRYQPSGIPTSFRSELGKHARTSISSSSKPVDPETQEKLASLGYVTGSSGNQVSSTFDPKDGIVLWTEIEGAVRDAQRSQWASSEKKFRNVLKKQPDNVIALKFLANVLRKQQKQDEAIAMMQAALKSPYHRAETRTHLAEAYLEKKDFKRALEQAIAAHRLEPENPRALALTASLQSRLNRDPEALQSYGKLASIRDLTEEEALQAAAIALTSKNNSEAEKYFRLAVDANSKSAPAWKGLALIFATRQQWEDSAAAFQKAGDCDSIHTMLKNVPNPSAKLETIRKQCKQ